MEQFACSTGRLFGFSSSQAFTSANRHKSVYESYGPAIECWPSLFIHVCLCGVYIFSIFFYSVGGIIDASVMCVAIVALFAVMSVSDSQLLTWNAFAFLSMYIVLTDVLIYSAAQLQECLITYLLTY